MKKSSCINKKIGINICLHVDIDRLLTYRLNIDWGVAKW